MSYTSYFYLLFFLGALVILYYLMPLKRRWLVLLGGSYFFYWLASGKLIVFLLITTVSVYLGALAMEREQKAFDSVRKSLEKEERKARKAAMMRRKRHIVLAMVLINVGLLAFLKYYHFCRHWRICRNRPIGIRRKFLSMFTRIRRQRTVTR